MNFLAATTSIVAVMLLMGSGLPLPDDLKQRLPIVGFFGIGLAGLLIVSSALALLRVRMARWLMLGTAVVFFGLLGYQNLTHLVSLWTPPPTDGLVSLWGKVIRNLLEIAINAWALFSAKATLFFLSKKTS